MSQLFDGGIGVVKDGIQQLRRYIAFGITEAVLKRQRDSAVEFKYGDCSSCHDGDVLLTVSEQEDKPLHYVCKECFLRGL